MHKRLIGPHLLLFLLFGYRIQAQKVTLAGQVIDGMSLEGPVKNILMSTIYRDFIQCSGLTDLCMRDARVYALGTGCKSVGHTRGIP